MAFARSSRLSDYYLILLSVVLMGYAFIGKGFAYLGLPPIYIGEIALLGGIFIVIFFLPGGCVLAAFATLPSVLLVATMVWVLLRTVPFFGEYGFDALRDSVVIMYGSFAIIVAALLFEDARRVDTILRYYDAFLRIFIPAIPFLAAISRFLGDYIPKFFNDVPLLQIRVGETAVHLAGAAVFALAGFRKLTPLEIILLLATMALVSTGRGAMVAIVLPVVFAVLLLGKVRQSVPALLAGLAIFGAAYAFESAFTDYRTDYRDARPNEARSLGTRQMVDNVMSIGGFGGEELEGTKQWRLEWWDIILEDTVYGPNFWTGRGFGLNLAEADGFTDGDHSDRPPLRSPHSVHMTILARAGVPGAVLWALFLASWFGIVMHAMLTARHRGQTEWAGLFLFICCYVMAIIIDATFDVALEGPMVGIWFWCLVGFGIGSVMVYRRKSIKRTITHRNA